MNDLETLIPQAVELVIDGVGQGHLFGLSGDFFMRI